ncbi:hypothetical protein ACU4GD_22365 [Cupriavidus basilensis]
MLDVLRDLYFGVMIDAEIEDRRLVRRTLMPLSASSELRREASHG